MRVCRTDRLYHYLLQGEGSLPSILSAGLLPLSALPEDDPRRAAIDAAHPGFYADLYRLFAEPILQRPYSNSGIFLTPIDFYLLPETRVANLIRLSIPLEGLALDKACLTYELGGRRQVLPLTAGALEETAQLWPDTAVRQWFGLNPRKLFYHVPQVMAYPDDGIRIRPDWVERP